MMIVLLAICNGRHTQHTKPNTYRAIRAMSTYLIAIDIVGINGSFCTSNLPNIYQDGWWVSICWLFVMVVTRSGP